MEPLYAQFIAAFIGAVALAFGQQIVPLIRTAMQKKKNKENEVHRLRRLLRKSLEHLYHARRVAVEHGAQPEELGEVLEELDHWDHPD